MTVQLKKVEKETDTSRRKRIEIMKKMSMADGRSKESKKTIFEVLPIEQWMFITTNIIFFDLHSSPVAIGLIGGFMPIRLFGFIYPTLYQNFPNIFLGVSFIIPLSVFNLNKGPMESVKFFVGKRIWNANFINEEGRTKETFSATFELQFRPFWFLDDEINNSAYFLRFIILSPSVHISGKALCSMIMHKYSGNFWYTGSDMPGSGLFKIFNFLTLAVTASIRPTRRKIFKSKEHIPVFKPSGGDFLE